MYISVDYTLLGPFALDGYIRDLKATMLECLTTIINNKSITTVEKIAVRSDAPEIARKTKQKIKRVGKISKNPKSVIKKGNPTATHSNKYSNLDTMNISEEQRILRERLANAKKNTKEYWETFRAALELTKDEDGTWRAAKAARLLGRNIACVSGMIKRKEPDKIHKRRGRTKKPIE